MKRLSAILCSVALMAALCTLPAVKSFAAGESASRTLVTGKISVKWIKEHGRDALAGDKDDSKTDDSTGTGNGNSSPDGNSAGEDGSSGQKGKGPDGSNSSGFKENKANSTDGSGKNTSDIKENSVADQAKTDNADSSNGKQDKLPQTGTLEPGLYRLVGGGLMAVSLIMLFAVAAKGRYHSQGRRRKFWLLGNY